MKINRIVDTITGTLIIIVCTTAFLNGAKWSVIGILIGIYNLIRHLFQGWSKVQKGKPIGWWYHKVMCELWYKCKGSGSKYYKHLNIMCDKYGFNLYGQGGFKKCKHKFKPSEVCNLKIDPVCQKGCGKKLSEL